MTEAAAALEVLDALVRASNEIDRQREEITRLQMENRQLRKRGVEWQPIETAPKDGTDLLVSYYLWGPRQAVAGWFEGDWLIFEKPDDPIKPAHWMPLPPPPLDGP